MGDGESLTEFLHKSDCLEIGERGRFDNVVVMGTKHYRDLLNKLARPKVKVLIESKLTHEKVEFLVKSEKEYSNGRTLWILTKSLYSICELDNHPDCKSCSDRLQYLFTRSQLSKTEIAEKVQDILYHTNKTCSSIQTDLGLNGTVLIVPPIPARIVQEAASRSHDELHRMCNMHGTPCASDVVLFRLHIFYNILCDAWSSLAIEWLLPFGKQSLFRDFQNALRGKNLVSIKNKEPHDYVEKGWLLIVNVLIQMALDGTLSKDHDLPNLSNLKDLSAGMLTLHHKEHVNAESDENSEQANKFEHCVIVGNSSFFTQLKEMLKGLPVSFLEKSMDLDEEGVNIIKAQKENYPENTVWLIIRGVSEIAELTDVSPRCEEAKCDDPLYVFVLKNDKDGNPDFKGLSISDMIEKVLTRVIEFSLTVSKHLHNSSEVFLAPIIPVSAYFGGINSALSHDKLHEYADKDPSIPVLAGSSKEWISSVLELDKQWLKMILDKVNQESTQYHVLQNQLKSSSNVLMFTNVPGKNTRLLEAQSAWGENLKAIISSLLSQEKKKTGKVNLALKTAGHWGPEKITANQEKKDTGYVAPDLHKMPEAAEIMQNTGLSILGPVPERPANMYLGFVEITQEWFILMVIL